MPTAREKVQHYRQVYQDLILEAIKAGHHRAPQIYEYLQAEVPKRLMVHCSLKTLSRQVEQLSKDGKIRIENPNTNQMTCHLAGLPDPEPSATNQDEFSLNDLVGFEAPKP